MENGKFAIIRELIAEGNVKEAAYNLQHTQEKLAAERHEQIIRVLEEILAAIKESK